MSLPHVALALVAVTAACAASPLPELRTEAVSGGSVFHVRNTAPQPLTGYLIELVDYPGSSYWLFQDELGEPIAAGAQKSIPVTNMTAGAAPEYVKITAAVYADGSSAGDAEKVALIRERRKAMLETTREAVARLQKAQQAGTANPVILADLKQWFDSLQPKGKGNRLSAENVRLAAAREVVTDTAAYLRQHSVQEALANLGKKEGRPAPGQH